MKDNFITAYFMRVDEEEGVPYKGYLGSIENTLSAKQRYVNFDDEDGGRIQKVRLNDEVDIICDEDGKILEFPANRAWVDDDGEVLDVFFGNIMALRHKGEDFTSILEADIPYIEKYLRPVIVLNGGIILQIPDEELPEYKGVDDGDSD